ncbi:hypothetical protein OG909_14955 [Streptomyces sp. NBC_01754]|uniref:hypothetical protein n=1 Tax=Streptomyces sp. NBC_01754 TaxID=2975930 RepID=UPI002DD9AC4E|nr:hypothetical protein [Streptomyces sp. NBC_01754]WSC93478.1 hypothetical protein OG909_14955 [Streptomyces sp. NBC_01754]
MRADLDLLGQVLNQPQPAGARAGPARAAARIAGLVAVVPHNRDDEEAPRRFATAQKAARESGDRTMTAWVPARHGTGMGTGTGTQWCPGPDPLRAPVA